MNVDKTEVIEGIFSNIFGYEIKIKENLKDGSINSMKTIKDFFSFLYHDTGFSFTYLARQHKRQISYDSLENLDVLLTVKTSYNYEFYLRCCLNESVGALKRRIEEEQAIDENYQILYYNNIRLLDHQILRTLKIQSINSFYLDLKIENFYLIINIHRNGRKIFECNETDTLDAILKKLRDNLDIKNLIMKTYYKMNKTLEQLGVKMGEEFLVRKEHFKGGDLAIKIFNSKSMWLNVEQGETVYNLKEKIFDKENIPIFKQILKFKGDILDNKETIDYYEIQDRDVLYLTIDHTNSNKISLNISRITGKTTVISDISTTDIIKNLKIKIHSKSNEPADLQSLSFNGKRLEDDKTIAYYNLNNGDTINLLIKIKDSGNIKILVKTLSGNEYDYKIDPLCTIEELKCMLNERFDINSNNMVIMFDGRNLKDHETFIGCNIKNKSILYLLARNNNSITLSAECLLHPKYDFDFTTIKDDDKTRHTRGSKPYIRPCGWKRIAIKAENQYENEIWIGHSNKPGEWPVAYHGTNFEMIKNIVPRIFKINNYNNYHEFNKAHLATVDIRNAEEFSQTIQIKGRMLKFVLQSRVRPENIIYNYDLSYMLLPSYDDLRPYAICYKFI